MESDRRSLRQGDGTLIGGLARFMHKDKKAQKITGTGGAGEELVMGLLDRETGKVRVKHVANRKRHTLQEEVRANVEAGAEVFHRRTRVLYRP